ncbi:SCO7613 C-terminal domain-containing membrane protein [Actinoplanes couchii]|uniref:SCO7613 C-terminal domain-containing membrane protein n=1 Tax=Actinoplanes couchii TaxID=403638 RepID=UPI0019435054|nr:hypothetical protein [Actinoplanes couchii]MDR6322264.1 hypothetical protein [Actinoplanes couchii]
MGLLVPASFGLVWWSAAVAGMLVAAVALGRAAWSRTPTESVFRVLLSGAFVSYAVLIGAGRAEVVAAVLGSVVLLGVGVALAVRAGARGRDVGAGSLVVGLVALGPAVWLGLLAADADVTTQVRASLLVAVVLCLVAHLIARAVPGYGFYALGVAVAVVVSAPLWSLPGSDPVVYYAAAALVLVVALMPAPTVRANGPAVVLVPAILPALALLGLTFTDVAVVVFEPWTAATDIWSDVAPVQSPVAWSSVIAIAVAGVAVALARLLTFPRPATQKATAEEAVAEKAAAAEAGRATAPRGGVLARTLAPFVALLVPLVLAAAAVPWPAMPIAALVCGLLGVTAAALTSARRISTDLAAVLCGVLAAAGAAGSLAGHGATIAAFALVVVASAVVGVAGAGAVARVTGWTAGSVALVVVAYTVGDLIDRGPAAPVSVLVAGALVVALEAVLRSRRPAEADAPFVVAHSAALIALLLADSTSWAAHVLRLWALVLVVRALRPRESRAVRSGYGLAASALTLISWWLLLWERDVETAEAYTLPAALLALAAGWLARRGRPELPSWSAYGPALAATFLPSLAVIAYSASDDPQYLRRLLLGVGALVVLLLGARARLQAPVVTGGGVLILVALHELVQFWDLVPRWVPLAVGGLLLVGIATTIEQRRRDLARLKGAITRLS